MLPQPKKALQRSETETRRELLGGTEEKSVSLMRGKDKLEDMDNGHITGQYSIFGRTTGGQHFQPEYFLTHLKNYLASFIL